MGVIKTYLAKSQPKPLCDFSNEGNGKCVVSE